MKSFKMKDLMIRIQPEAGGDPAYLTQAFDNNLTAEWNFGTCTSPSTCGTPSTCSSNQSCKPSRCGDNKPKPKHHSGELSAEVIELTDLKNMLADMQIKMNHVSPEVSEMF